MTSFFESDLTEEWELEFFRGDIRGVSKWGKNQSGNPKE
jgi:hypothetical protein